MNKKFFLSCLFVLCMNVISFAQESYSQYFEECGVKGSTTIYDYKNKKWIFTDKTDANVETLPASTFKIVNSLIAFETKAVRDVNDVFKWDGTVRTLGGKPYAVWNKDTNIQEAFKNSTVWAFVDIAKKVGRKNYEKYLSKINYGNGNLTEKGTDFWNYGDYGVSPKNQVDFLIKLYENKLPFSKKNMETVKKIMTSDKNELGLFHEKSGWTSKNGKNIGWWAGYVTTDDNVYFFATRILQDQDKEQSNFAECRKSITKKILKEVIK